MHPHLKGYAGAVALHVTYRLLEAGKISFQDRAKTRSEVWHYLLGDTDQHLPPDFEMALQEAIWADISKHNDHVATLYNQYDTRLYGESG